MIDFYELFRSTYTAPSLCDFLFWLIIVIIVVIIIFSCFLNDINSNLKGILILSTITIFVVAIPLISFIQAEKEKKAKENFYKVIKIHKLDIDYYNFISENKKLYEFCLEKRRKTEYENFCKIEDEDVNSDTLNEVFNELYTSNNRIEKNKLVEEAIQFIKENKIQIKIDNKTKGEKHD